MRLYPLLFLLLCICLAGPARGEHKDFADFSVDIPPGWTMERDGITTAFVAGDKSATLQVTVESISSIAKDGISARELAEAYAHELKGSVPVMEDNDPNYYSFTFKSPEGLMSEASIVVSGRRFYLITISGKHPDLARMVESVLLSIL